MEKIRRRDLEMQRRGATKSVAGLSIWTRMLVVSGERRAENMSYKRREKICSSRLAPTPDF